MTAALSMFAHRVGSRGQCLVAQRQAPGRGVHELFTKVIKLSPAPAYSSPWTFQLAVPNPGARCRVASVYSTLSELISAASLPSRANIAPRQSHG